MGKKLNQRPESESVHLGQPIERTDTLSWSTLPAAAVVDTIIHFNGPSLAFFCDNNSYPLLSTAFETDAPWEARGKNKECLLKEVILMVWAVMIDSFLVHYSTLFPS